MELEKANACLEKLGFLFRDGAGTQQIVNQADPGLVAPRTGGVGHPTQLME